MNLMSGRCLLDQAARSPKSFDDVHPTQIPAGYKDHTLVKLTTLAHIVGQSRRTVEGWIATQGMPVAARGMGRGRPTLISLEEWFRWHQARSDASGLKEGRARLAQAQADKAELEFRLLSGTTLRMEDVEIRWTRMITNARAKALGLVRRLPSAVRQTDFSQRAIAAVTKELVYEFLTELSTYGGETPRQDEKVPVGCRKSWDEDPDDDNAG